MRTLDRKVVMLGDSGVGKTALAQRYVNGKFVEEYRPTSAAASLKKTLEQEGVLVKLVIWDVAGNLLEFHHAYSSDADGVLLVCDMNRPDRALTLEKWLGAITGKLGNVPLIIAANKSDMAKLPQACTERLPGDPTIILTSARTGENVDRLFQELVARMM